MEPFEKNLRKLLEVYKENGEKSFSNYRVNLMEEELDFCSQKALYPM